MTDIFKKIEEWYKLGLPFVVYNKPNQNNLVGLFQKSDTIFYSEKFKESGFVFAPFDVKQNKSIIIPFSDADKIEAQLNVSTIDKSRLVSKPSQKEQEFHVELVEDGIKSIKNNQFRKVVLSRREICDFKNDNFMEVFKKLLTKYKTAMVYVWYHPKVGFWLGATPETLVKINNNTFETMSLAGTQVYKGSENVTWQDKEIDEQKVVTDFILEKLNSVCSNVVPNKVETIKAGNLLHLRTVIKGEFDLDINKSELVDALHPTPAVCGLPKEKAKSFILNNENYNREFYTGFFGELNNNGKTDLYVNLRCMQLKSNKALIYVGGGITVDSNSLKEWKETVSKSETMKSVL